MRTRKIIPGPVLMLVTILIVTGFQVYWLKNNYDREKRTLQIKINVAFQETVRHLQALKLKLKEPFTNDSLHKDKMRIFVDDDLQAKDMKQRMMPKREIVTMVNAMRDKISDSLKGSPVSSTVIISMNKENGGHQADS